MTEDEARKKWCPFAREVTTSEFGEPIVGVNRYHDGAPGEGSFCIASDCMAWQHPDGPQEYGYCGLAGRLRP